jgi:hypothetical protein
MILALAAAKDLELYQMDIETAFQHQILKEEIFMEQPAGFVESGTTAESHVCKLNRVLYGLKPGAVELHKHLMETLGKFGYQVLSIDRCVFYKTFDDKGFILGAIHIDDILCACIKSDLYEQFKRDIGTIFPIKDLGCAKFLLDMLITRDRSSRSIHISQAGKVDSMLKLFNMTDCKPVKTPFEAIDQDSDSKDSGRFPYRETVGHLMYIANMTRPDITFAVGKAARAVSNYNSSHVKLLKRFLRYVKGTKHYGIMFQMKQVINLSKFTVMPISQATFLIASLLLEALSYLWVVPFSSNPRSKAVSLNLLLKLSILLCSI